jgi:hypothetical protein
MLIKEKTRRFFYHKKKRYSPRMRELLALFRVYTRAFVTYTQDLLKKKEDPKEKFFKDDFDKTEPWEDDLDLDNTKPWKDDLDLDNIGLWSDKTLNEAIDKMKPWEPQGFKKKKRIGTVRKKTMS